MFYLIKPDLKKFIIFSQTFLIFWKWNFLIFRITPNLEPVAYPEHFQTSTMEYFGANTYLMHVSA